MFCNLQLNNPDLIHSYVKRLPLHLNLQPTNPKSTRTFQSLKSISTPKKASSSMLILRARIIPKGSRISLSWKFSQPWGWRKWLHFPDTRGKKFNLHPPQRLPENQNLQPYLSSYQEWWPDWFSVLEICKCCIKKCWIYYQVVTWVKNKNNRDVWIGGKHFCVSLHLVWSFSALIYTMYTSVRSFVRSY